MDETSKWIEEEHMDIFWHKHRVAMGWSPDGSSLIQERLYWNEAKKARERCLESDDPEFIFNTAAHFDRQYFLEKWWERLNHDEKKKYLLNVWLNKITAYLYGLDWWIPYFKEAGYISNFGKEKPNKPVKVYRGVEPYFKRGMSWTTDYDHAMQYKRSYALFEGMEKRLFETTVFPKDILAVIVIWDDQLEGYKDEYIINHQELGEITTVE